MLGHYDSGTLGGRPFMPRHCRKTVLMNILIKLFVPATLLAWLCVLYVDRPVSLFVHENLYGNRYWSRLTSTMPDTLLTLVVVISAAAFIAYFFRKKKLLLDRHTRLLGHIALSLPISYVVKVVLKIIFGRVETRFWLKNQHLYEFHWFHSCGNFSGFPSGHMIVFATLAAATARYEPSYKLLCHSLLGILAILLVATNYHFVGDVLYGTYIGFLTEWCMYRFCRWETAEKGAGSGAA